MSAGRAGRRAVVLGAGIGGIAAAGALAPYFDKVIVLERDRLLDTAEPRLGALQGRHLHILLAGGQRALEALYPGFTAALVEAGAVAARMSADIRLEAGAKRVAPRRDFGWSTYNASRPLVELVARRAARSAGVEFIERARVRGLEASADGGAIAAVLFEDEGKRPHRLAADLVIDATGRGHPTLDLLKSLGRPAPPETAIQVELGYASGLFERPSGALADWVILTTFPDPGGLPRGAVLSPIEHDRWILTMGGRAEDAPPTDEAGFAAWATGLSTPSMSRFLAGARPLGEIAGYGFRESVWRHFDRLDPLPRGLVPFADSLCRFNPVYGQGMSVAAQEGALLARLLASRAEASDPLDGLSAQFLTEANAILEGPWRMSAIPDLALPTTKGERPSDLDQMLAFGAALSELAWRDPEVNELEAKVRQLLEPPSALADPALVARVLEVMAETQTAA